MSKTVFISRSMDANNFVARNLQQHGVQLIADSLISIRPVAFEAAVPATEWIFFSSINAVKQFFAQQPKLHNQKCGAIGQATAAELSRHAPVHFTGQGNDTTEVARAFAQEAGDARVLFPQGNESLRAVQQYLEPYQCIDLVCYATEANPRPVGTPDVLVFSSPSNVNSFFITNGYLQWQRCIAFGSATAGALHENGVDSVMVLDEISDDVLLEAINEALYGSPHWS